MDARSLDQRGVAQSRAGETDAAIASFRAALERDATYANAASNLGKALLDAGDIDEAVGWLERAIDLEPQNGSHYLPLVTATSARIAPTYEVAMVALADAIETLPPAERIDLHFALAAVDERAGRIDAAFEHLRAGNALKRAEVAYDEAAALAFVASTEAAFGNPFMEQLRGCGDPSERPIFVFGMPRSGSTLVEQLLAAHPQVAAAGEIGALAPIVREVWPTIRATTLDDLRAQIRRIGERYLDVTRNLPPTPPGAASATTHLVDKTLDNLQVAPLIHVTLPNARMIHVRRDAIDTCLSCFATIFGDAQVPFSYDLTELGHYYRAYTRMMDRWHAFVQPDRLLEVDYERLVDDFESEARRIIAFCGLEWDPACLAFHAVRRPVRTASNVQVRQPLYRGSVGRAEPFHAHLAPLIAALSPLG